METTIIIRGNFRMTKFMKTVGWQVLQKKFLKIAENIIRLSRSTKFYFKNAKFCSLKITTHTVVHYCNKIHYVSKI